MVSPGWAPGSVAIHQPFITGAMNPCRFSRSRTVRLSSDDRKIRLPSSCRTARTLNDAASFSLGPVIGVLISIWAVVTLHVNTVAVSHVNYVPLLQVYSARAPQCKASWGVELRENPIRGDIRRSGKRTFPSAP